MPIRCKRNLGFIAVMQRTRQTLLALHEGLHVTIAETERRAVKFIGELFKAGVHFFLHGLETLRGNNLVAVIFSHVESVPKALPITHGMFKSQPLPSGKKPSEASWSFFAFPQAPT